MTLFWSVAMSIIPLGLNAQGFIPGYSLQHDSVYAEWTGRSVPREGNIVLTHEKIFFFSFQNTKTYTIEGVGLMENNERYYSFYKDGYLHGLYFSKKHGVNSVAVGVLNKGTLLLNSMTIYY